MWSDGAKRAFCILSMSDSLALVSPCLCVCIVFLIFLHFFVLNLKNTFFQRSEPLGKGNQFSKLFKMSKKKLLIYTIYIFK